MVRLDPTSLTAIGERAAGCVGQAREIALDDADIGRRDAGNRDAPSAGDFAEAREISRELRLAQRQRAPRKRRSFGTSASDPRFVRAASVRWAAVSLTSIESVPFPALLRPL